MPVLVLSGVLCSGAPVRAELPTNVPGTCTVEPALPSVVAGAPLTARDAVAAALVANPDLAVESCEIRVREAQQVVAGLLPNPELRLEVENVAGSGQYRGDNQAETTVFLSQLFELGGKRGKRARVAGLGSELAGWDYVARRAAVLSATMKAVVQTLAAQERLAIAAERVQIAERSLRSVTSLVEAGAAPPVDASRAHVVAGRARVAHQRATHALTAARIQLAGVWGSVEPSFSHVDGSLRTIPHLTAFDESVEAIAGNPEVARWETERAHRAATRDVAVAARVPNVSIGAGGRYFSLNDDHALVVELSVPIPVLDRGDARVGVAQQQLAQAALERRRVERTIRVELAAARQRMVAARDDATVLRDRLLPEAERAIATAADAYRRGLVHFTDLLDTELVAFELREEEIAALERAHLAAVDIARLTGVSPVLPEKESDQ